MNIINENILNQVYKSRKKTDRKYIHGILLIIGGGEFYSGAPALTGMAAFRAGVDMVRIIAPKRPADIIANFSPNLAAFPLKGDYLSKEHLPILLSMIESSKIISQGRSAVVIGGGLGRSEEVKETVLEYISKVDEPIVIDADGIHAISKNPKIINNKDCLLTPHSYEFYILTKREVEDLKTEEKIKIVKEEAKKLKTTILLKGRVDIISNGDETAINKTGNPAMTVGGTGDTLAGICGCFLTWNIKSFTAACAAAYLNGRAGDIAVKRYKEGLLATDIINAISEIIP